jgi:hypothetical protein
VEQWRICVKDKYPAYISWTTFEQIQTMLANNYAEYANKKTRGIPRPGAALLHGLVYCGACGHKMVVQYKTGNRYLCNYLRQQYQVPVCQRIPADPVDATVVTAFFAALSVIEPTPIRKRLPISSTSTQPRIVPNANSCNGCAIKRPSPNASSNTLIQPIDWSPPNWNGAGKWRCGICTKWK